jgi:hypothetical protein
MSTSIETPRPSRNRGKGGRADRRRSRDLAALTRERLRDDRRLQQARVEDAARQRRVSAAQRNRRDERILDLLRRGAGVSQILREIGQPNDTLADSLNRATYLQRVLEAVATGSSEARGVRIVPRRDMERITAYLDGCIRLLQDEVAQQALKASRRRAGRRRVARQARRRPAAITQGARA